MNPRVFVLVAIMKEPVDRIHDQKRKEGYCHLTSFCPRITMHQALGSIFGR